jgi:hypothetical protein
MMGAQSELIRLHEILAKRFDVEELRTLCFHLGVDYDDLKGEGKTGKARELVAFLERHRRIGELVAIGKQLRPDADWDVDDAAIPLPTSSPHPERLRELKLGSIMQAFDNALALVVGIANYQYINQLPSTVVRDAQDIHNLLVDPQYCGYLPDNVTLLTDHQATRAALLNALDALKQQSTIDSTVFFYISCHGGQIRSGHYAGEYLLPVDTNNESIQAFTESAISGAMFTEMLSMIPARKVLAIFDCCHAGGIGRTKGSDLMTFKTGLPETYYDKLHARHGRAILASSRSNELSWIFPGATNSLFTTHLLAGLRGKVASDDSFIRIFDLFEYLQPKVSLDQPKQHPIFKTELEENFPVALYYGGQKVIAPKNNNDFRYDAYISYVNREPDATWVWETLLPKLEAAGLRAAISGDVEQPGVARVVNVERGIKQSKRTIIVLSQAYLTDFMANFENTLAQTMGIQEGTYRLLPVSIQEIDESRLPMRLNMLSRIDLTNHRRIDRELTRLIVSLQGSLPHQ